LIVHGLTSPPTQYTLCGRRFLQSATSAYGYLSFVRNCNSLSSQSSDGIALLSYLSFSTVCSAVCLLAVTMHYVPLLNSDVLTSGLFWWVLVM